MAKMKNKWIVLCSAAVTAVYAAGYITTADQASRQQYADVSTTPAASAVPAVPYSGNSGAPQTADSSPSSTPARSIYKDGTYTGMGSNRRGSIQVTLTIANDKITDVEISRFGMHYSESDVAGLPSEVLHNQNSQVTNVSGATYSTKAFQSAVQDALMIARNA
ncbi:FMN-binding protein [Paenibacillus sabinae]|uniref:FMN-binding domain-containing protein n=1 Tax=Paenibacillus sabinae T27 TaxID=1268072 RepID=X5A767_9BACL|nr:FMN-binding protein [Paenibacillus sabinae]AHV99649.1 FMN-binding domain-containing protein [Paenibacillus sabinae T27]